MRTLWKIYYLFVRPKSKSDIAIAYCRKNGKPYKKLNLVRNEDEL